MNNKKFYLVLSVCAVSALLSWKLYKFAEFTKGLGALYVVPFLWLFSLVSIAFGLFAIFGFKSGSFLIRIIQSVIAFLLGYEVIYRLVSGVAVYSTEAYFQAIVPVCAAVIVAMFLYEIWVKRKIS